MAETETGDKPDEAPTTVGFFDPRLKDVRRKAFLKWGRTGI